jgi:hypothetical protein
MQPQPSGIRVTKMISLVFLLALLQVGDVMTTLKILGNGGKELNPIMNWLFTEYGAINVLVLKAILVTCIGVMFYQLMPLILVPVCLLYIAVVGWNTYEIFKH